MASLDPATGMFLKPEGEDWLEMEVEDNEDGAVNPHALVADAHPVGADGGCTAPQLEPAHPPPTAASPTAIATSTLIPTSTAPRPPRHDAHSNGDASHADA